MRLSTPSPSLIRKGLTVALSASLLTLVILFFASTSSLTWRTLSSFNPMAMLFLGLLVILSWVVEGLRVQLIGRVLGERLSLRKILGINMATLFSGNITPFTSGGAPTQVFLLHRSGVSLGKATAMVTLRMALSTLFFTIGGPILIFLFQKEILTRLNLMAFAVPIRIALFLALGASIGIVFILWRPSRGNTFADWLFSLKWVQHILKERTESWRQGFLREMAEFNDALQVIRNKPIHLFWIMVYTFCYWIIFFSIAPAILLGFGLSIGSQLSWIIFLQFVLLFLLSFIPIPGGSGVAELGFYSVFAFFVPKHILAIVVALWRLSSYHLSTLVGGVFFIKLIGAKTPSQADLPG